jgi:hypothetical protein
MLCGECNDIRAMDPGGAWTRCRCGNMQARWVDPRTGTVAVSARDRTTARIIGLHNGFLRAAYQRPALRNEGWREAHDDLVDHAHGYVFHRSNRACPVAIVRVGDTSDIRWVEDWPGIDPPE